VEVVILGVLSKDKVTFWEEPDIINIDIKY